ncbi:MAG: enoyl-CoA hydratase/isomerase family protein [Xanthomonadales bacterium]|nr:enoyl-CoA hydratase/isomerase family protein [Xanthomonadales bacterium]
MIETLRHDEILELRLARPPANALDGALIAALLDAVRRAPAEDAAALVLSGQPGMFSAGLDVPALLELDRAAMARVWEDFSALMRAIALSPIPVACAITGHSPAGGAVLALFCDHRVMARAPDPARPYRIGLNEVAVGLIVPDPIARALARLVGPHRAERLLVEGRLLTAEEAMTVGLVDALAEPETVVPEAIAWCRRHLALPRLAMSGTRRIARAGLAEAFEDPSLDTEDFLDHWFGEEAQAALRALVARLRQR